MDEDEFPIAKVHFSRTASEESSRELLQRMRRAGLSPSPLMFVWPPAAGRAIVAFSGSGQATGRGLHAVPRRWPPLWRAWLRRSVRRRLPGHGVELFRQDDGHWFVAVTAPPAPA